MGKASDSFWRQMGKNSANAVFNSMGINHGSRVCIDRNDNYGRAELDSARASSIIAQQKRDRQNELNMLDSAVINNIDIVSEIQFSNDPNVLVEQLMQLCIQLNVNSFDSNSAETKIRAKYTNAVLVKLDQGLYYLENLDPHNPHYNYLFGEYKKALSKKRNSSLTSNIVWGIIVVAVATIFLTAFFEGNTKLREFEALAAGLVVEIPLLAIYIFFKFKTYKKPLEEHKQNLSMRLSMPVSTNAPKSSVKEQPNQFGQQPQRPKEVVSLGEQSVEEKSFWHKMNDDLWEKFGNLHEILARGFCICDVNEQKDVLVVGMNPSFPPSSTPGNLVYKLPNESKGYWGDVNRMLKSTRTSLHPVAAYLDVFSFRESSQAIAEKEIICNQRVFPYVLEQIESVQKIIEKVIRPKVIIIKNKGAWAFFGKYPEFTWMGYEFEQIDKFNSFDVCRIKGFSNRKDRINQSSLTDTNLKGTIVVFANHTDVIDYPDPMTIIHWIGMAR